jgi:hypothetical protein
MARIATTLIAIIPNKKIKENPDMIVIHVQKKLGVRI